MEQNSSTDGLIFRNEYENCSDIGCYSRLTNSYCLVTYCDNPSFYSVFEEALSSYIPVIQTSIFNSTLVGTLTVGNRNGLLVPSTTTDQELQHLRNSLPENVRIQRIEERLSALGNVIRCNDYVALIHPEIDIETEYIISDILGVEVFRHSISNQALVGSYANFNNLGGIVHPNTTVVELEELSNLLQIPLTAGTVNRGSSLVGTGFLMNDWSLFCGTNTTGVEMSILSKFISLDPLSSTNPDRFKKPILEHLI